MKVIAAYLLAVLGGNISPTGDDLKSILESVGADVDEKKIELLLSQVHGNDLTELIATGRDKIASVPCGGGGAVAVAAIAGGGGGASAAPAVAEPKKEEKVEEKEESDDDMGFSLFD
ncbi:large ribosomal subunit protein P2A-like [Musa acuminata AAA Group]|uniref:large ribosomal subunit protein P2A-like n=1 Tax=Musa acuminata AAA Group TaxID=214697 RepID=UPI0031DE355C